LWSTKQSYTPSGRFDSLAVHMSLQAVSHQKQLAKLETHIQELKAENSMLKEELKKLSTHVHIMPVQFVVNDFTDIKKKEEEWISQPFYTHPRGYKMCLTVIPAGDGEGEGSHISVFIAPLRGEFDSELNWPFLGSMTVTLLDQEGEKHVAKIDSFTLNYESNEYYECQSCWTGKQSWLGCKYLHCS
jgi:regulator of replication initiation timing